jgi:uncharacterized protein
VALTRVLLEGAATGPALVLAEPLSMWGGLDPISGEIIDRRHPQSGLTVTGSVMFLPWGRGSSSASSVLAEAIRRGTAPLSIVMLEPDDIILLGALAAEELYAITCPILIAEPNLYATVATGDLITITTDGVLHVAPRP